MKHFSPICFKPELKMCINTMIVKYSASSACAMLFILAFLDDKKLYSFTMAMALPPLADTAKVSLFFIYMSHVYLAE